MTLRAPVRHAEQFLALYVMAVAAGGIALAAILAMAGIRSAAHSPLAFGLATAGAVLGERASIRVRWHGKTFCYTLASPFVLALLTLSGLPAAMLAAVAATLVDDVVGRSTLRKTAFNVGQASLTLGAPGLLYVVLSDRALSSWRHAFLFCVVAVLNLTLSDLAVRTAVGLERQTASAAHLLEHTRLYALTAFLNAGLTLAVLLAVPSRPFVPVILAASLLAVYVACRNATREHQARAAAETSQIRAETNQTLAEKAQAEAEAARADAERGRVRAERLAAERAQMLEIAEGLVLRLHARDRRTRDTLALVALELREPLRPIAGITTSLLDHGHLLPAAARRELLAAALHHAEDASQATEQLLQGASHHRTQPTVVPAPSVTDAAECLRQAGQLATFTHRGRPIQVHAPRPLPVQATPDMLDHILDLLLDNAGCHTPAGSPIQLEAIGGDGSVVLAVQDHGPGIADTDRERIFDRFTRLHGTGLGVGLHLARSLARKQGGELTTVDPSGSDRGARFELTLPPAPPTTSRH